MLFSHFLAQGSWRATLRQRRLLFPVMLGQRHQRCVHLMLPKEQHEGSQPAPELPIQYRLRINVNVVVLAELGPGSKPY